MLLGAMRLCEALLKDCEIFAVDELVCAGHPLRRCPEARRRCPLVDHAPSVIHRADAVQYSILLAATRQRVSYLD
jgi:hypothetical protein